MVLLVRMGLGVVVAVVLSTGAAWVWAQGEDAPGYGQESLTARAD
jgi:hypothetical protein